MKASHLFLAISLAAPAAWANQADTFWQGLSTVQQDPNYDFLTHCKRDCTDPKKSLILAFWYNSMLGSAEATSLLMLTPQSQAAARFLSQSTFGPTAYAVDELATVIEKEGEAVALERWVDSQINTPQSHLYAITSNVMDHSNVAGWWQHSLTAPDQLRQRVAFALNHIQTISLLGTLTKDGTLSDYYDMLGRHAFGNFRELLTGVTYHIGMGVYLDNTHNQKKGEDYKPNENYARELMQLFSIGEELLNVDGTPIVDESGQPLAAYTEDDVVMLARALSGFSRSGKWFGDLTLKSKFHDFTPKSLFSGTAYAKDLQASSASEEVELALDAVFNHPNVAPFMATRLIQHLVTSNPSPLYVSRVAAVFNDNGQGVRGDLAAVIRTVLLDPEARNPQGERYKGKLKAPVLRLTNLLRAFAVDPAIQTASLLSTVQKPLYAPSVFSYFQPYDSPEGELVQNGYVAPEFTLATDSNLAVIHNVFYQLIFEQGYPRKHQKKGYYSRLDLSREAAMASTDPDALLDRYNLLLMGGGMDPVMKQKIVGYLNTLPTDDGGLERARKALYLVMTSPAQAVQQ